MWVFIVGPLSEEGGDDQRREDAGHPHLPHIERHGCDRFADDAGQVRREGFVEHKNAATASAMIA
jgi:hypothetical protein